MVGSSAISSDLAPQQELLDKRYSEKLDQLHLFLNVSQDSLSCVRFDDQERRYVGLSYYSLGENKDWITTQRKLEKVLPNHHFQSFKSCRIAIDDFLYTLVPTALFDENKLESYIAFNHNIDDTSQLRYYYDKVESFDTIVVYALPRGLDFLVKAKLPSFQWSHFASPLLEALYLEKLSFKQLIIHIGTKRIDILFAPEGKLTFFNSFKYENREDLLYYLLYVMEQLQLDREETAIKIWGKLDQESSTFELLNQYIRKVEQGSFLSEVYFSQVLSDVKTNHFFNLFNQHLCE